MSVRVLFFATLADITGMRETRIEAPAQASADALFTHFVTRFPRLETYRSSVLCAVNSEFAHLDGKISDGDEIAFFPPMSGG